MRWLWILCTVVMAVTADEPGQRGQSRGHHSHEEESHADHYHGHHMFDFTTIGILLALKLKLILLGLAVAGIAILIKNSKPTFGYYPYIDYEYAGYPVPPAYAGAPYRRPVALAPKSMYLSELTARVWNSIDFPGMALGAVGVPAGSCRQKIVCQAQRAADNSVIMKRAMSWFEASLSKYKPRSGNQQPDSCEELYADCPTYNLPSFLGGSEKRIHPTPVATLQHFNTPWFGQSMPPITNYVSPQAYRPNPRPDPRRDMIKSTFSQAKTSEIKV